MYRFEERNKNTLIDARRARPRSHEYNIRCLYTSPDGKDSIANERLCVGGRLCIPFAYRVLDKLHHVECICMCICSGSTTHGLCARTDLDRNGEPFCLFALHVRVCVMVHSDFIIRKNFEAFEIKECNKRKNQRPKRKKNGQNGELLP